MLQHRNTDSEASQAAFRCNDELTRYFSYVIAKERLPFPPDNWGEGKEVFKTIIEKSGC